MKLQHWLIVGCVSLVLASCGSSVSSSQSSDPVAQSPAVTQPSEPVATETATPSDLASADSADIIKSGSFESGEHPTVGTAQLVRQGDGVVLVFDQSFQTDNGPDLVVALHRSDNVLGSTNPPAYPLNEGDYVVLEPLQSTSGEQQYAVPSDLNPDDFRSAVIWCRRFNATFGAATLQ
jgi:hypothetical protein